MRYRALTLSFLMLPLIGWGSINLGGGVPDAVGGGTFCDSAPTNVYCQDFEVTGSNCTLEDPALDNNSADCGFTPALSGGDSESAEITADETMVAADSYTHNNTSCVTFNFMVTNNANSGFGLIVWSATSAGGSDTFPRMSWFTGPAQFGLECSSGVEADDFAHTVDTLYKMEIEMINSTGACQWWANDSLIGSNNGTDNPANDVGFRFASIAGSQALTYKIENYYVSAGACP